MLNNKIYTIAETAMHHEGDFDFQKDLIDLLIKKTDVDYIKLHMLLDPDEYFLPDHSLYITIKKWIFSEKQWKYIIDKINRSNKKIMLLFNDTKSIELGMSFKPDIVEIHSVCLNDIKLLKTLKSNISEDTKVVLGIGGSSLYEIENAIKILNHSNIVLMFGFQNYPTKYEHINLKKMRKIMNLYPNYEFGYADHTAWNHPDNVLITLMGASLGMNYIEKHVTNKYGEERTDSSAAISFEMLNDLIEKLILLEKCNGNGLLELTPGEKKYSVFGPMKKAGVLDKSVNKGDKLSVDDIVFKRTAQISDMSQTEVLEAIGKQFIDDFDKDSCIKRSMFE